MSHGHMFPNLDGSVNRCGGPAVCGKCSQEQSEANAAVNIARSNLGFPPLPTGVDAKLAMLAYEHEQLRERLDLSEQRLKALHETFTYAEIKRLQNANAQLREGLDLVIGKSHGWVIRESTASIEKLIHDGYRAIAERHIKRAREFLEGK